MEELLEISGAKEHNLKNINVSIPHNKLVVVTGVSGSGKTSLAYDVIFKEGQRRYLQSVSAYARIFMNKTTKPDVASVTGLRPALSVNQRSIHISSRSTVGTITGIYDVLRLLFARFALTEDNINLKRSMFSFNSEDGACPLCKGLGVVDEIAENLLIADETLSIRDGAFEMTTPSGYIVYSQVTMDVLNQVCEAHGFTVDIPWKDLTREQKDIVLYGSDKIKVPFGKHTLESRMKWSGITARPREEGYYKGIINVMEDILHKDRNKNILRFARTVTCQKCEGKRLSQTALSARYRNYTIDQLCCLSFYDLLPVIAGFCEMSDCSQAESLLLNKISSQCETAVSIGLGHLSLMRGSETVSLGEGQRLKLLTLAANAMQDMVYVLDEPSIGLHPAEIQALIILLCKLRNKGNTVIVVEHDLNIIRAADFLIDIGPAAGTKGGQLIYAGELRQFINSKKFACPTRDALLKKPAPPVSDHKFSNFITINEAVCHNLKHISPRFAVNMLNVVTGVSGAGKTTLIENELLPQINNGTADNAGFIKRIIKIDQKPIGRNSRSNAATYTGLMDELRNLLAAQPKAREAGFKKSHFSFNNKGGRCEKCEGTGILKMGMHFMEDISTICPECQGKRFKPEILKIKYKNHNIADLLDMTVDKMLSIFEIDSKAGRILSTLQQVGLGYLTLGQPATTISGGEAQRIKLAAELARVQKEGTLYYLDEPTCGLHDADITRLIKVLRGLVNKGNTVILIEHDSQVITNADWIIDLGPGSGSKGGYLLFNGTPAELWRMKDNLTAQALRGEIKITTLMENPGAEKLIMLHKVETNNLKQIDVKLRHKKLNVICGVSGSGKTSLAFATIYAEAWQNYLGNLPAYSASLLSGVQRGKLESFSGMGAVLALRQEKSPVSSRSTVATYCGLYDILRMLYSRLSEGIFLDYGKYSFNNPDSACPRCKGIGSILSCDPEKLISFPDKSIFDGAMDGTKRGRYYGEKNGQFLAVLKAVERAKDIDLHKPWQQLSNKDKDIIMYGTGELEYEVLWQFERGKRQGDHHFSSRWQGFVNLINSEYERVHQKRAAKDVLPLLSKKVCPACKGKRLSDIVLKNKINGYDIADICKFEISEFITYLEPKDSEDGSLKNAAWYSIKQSLDIIVSVFYTIGLGYLRLDRSIDSLSGSEFQRLRLVNHLFSKLTGVTYIFDEVTRGLHQREREGVLSAIQKLVELGNTVICVEHDPLFIKAADHILELGPGAGDEGGEIIAQGTLKNIMANKNSLIKKYLEDKPVPFRKLPVVSQSIKVQKAAAHNLDSIDVEIPLGLLLGICGPGGSGKTSLCRDVLYQSYIQQKPVACSSISGFEYLDDVIYLSQNDLSKNPLSTIATYLGWLKIIGRIIAKHNSTPEHKVPAALFNYAGKSGQCPACKGTGYNRQNLDFAGYIDEPCEICNASRYNEQAMTFLYNGKNIAQILQLSINEARDFFADQKTLVRYFERMIEMGMGYIKLGQGCNTLSGGEAQRLLLAARLQKSTNRDKELYILEEPANGLHPEDIDKMARMLQKMADGTKSVIIIEHNLRILKAVDWIIELGPGGGEDGGTITFNGFDYFAQD